MVDTLKTKSQLLTVDFVANAGTKDIGSQQFRNGVVSTFGCYAGLVTNGGATQFTLVAATFQDVKPFVSAMASQDLTTSLTDGTITVPTGGDGVYDVSFYITLQRDAVVGADEFFIKLLKGATEICTQAVSIDANAQFGHIAGGSTVTCVATDVLKLQIANVGGALATLVAGAFKAKRIG